MSDRTITVLRLCALPANDPLRSTMHAELVAAAVTPRKVDAKFEDFARRGFITSIDWTVATLTSLGQRQLQRLS